MRSKRLLVTCALLGGLTIALAIAGYVCGLPLVEWKMGLFDGKPEFILRTPTEMAGIPIATALMFGWPGVSTIAAVAIHRWRREADASVRQVIVYFAIPVVILVGFIVLRAYQMPAIPSADTGIRPRIMLLDLAPGAEEARLVGFLSVCLWIFIGTRKRPKL